MDWGLHKIANEVGFTDTDLDVSHVSFNGIQIDNLQVAAKEGNFSVGSVELLYQPADLAEGRVNAISLSNPALQIDLYNFSEWLSKESNKSEDKRTLQEKVAQSLSSPLVRFLRLRNGSIDLTDGTKSVFGSVNLQADMYENLAQVRMDGNLSGMPWSTESTSVLEDSDLFISTRLRLPDLSRLLPFTESIPMIPNELLTEFSKVQIEQGQGSVQWTGRVKEDGIIDQFMEVNSSNVVINILGLSLAVPRSLLFVTPTSSSVWESNLYANLNWGENLKVNGMNIRARMDSGNLALNSRVKALVTGGILPDAELLGLSVDSIDLSTNDEGEITGFKRLDARFSALHLEAGLLNLYDGVVSVEWMGENRFQVELIKANASLPSLGINLQNLSYSGEINLDELPSLSKDQTFTSRAIFIGEDQKIEDVSIGFTVDSSQRVKFSKIELKVEDLECTANPANLAIEWVQGNTGALSVSLMDSQIEMFDGDTYLLKNLGGNLKFSSLDPLETNGTQSLTFDIEVSGREFQNGKVLFEVLPTGVKVIDLAEIEVFGGVVALDRTVLSEAEDSMELRLRASNLISQAILDSFDDLDARMDGNLSGKVSLRKLYNSSWDFYGGFLSLDPTELAHLSLNLDGALTDGLNPEGSEYQNMIMLEKALADLNLDTLKVNFNLLEDGDRVVEMNVIGESMVEGKKITVEYRPKIIGGLEALLQQLDLSKVGSASRNF